MAWLCRRRSQPRRVTRLGHYPRIDGKLQLQVLLTDSCIHNMQPNTCSCSNKSCSSFTHTAPHRRSALSLFQATDLVSSIFIFQCLTFQQRIWCVTGEGCSPSSKKEFNQVRNTACASLIANCFYLLDGHIPFPFILVYRRRTGSLHGRCEQVCLNSHCIPDVEKQNTIL